MRAISLVVALLGLSLFSTVRAQHEPLPATVTPRFERFSMEHGLSQSLVMSVIQDRRGFMWFGTQDGLNRFDGYGFTVYQYDPDDPNSLSHNEVRAMLESRDGSLWIATWGGGLNRFDPGTERFTRFQYDPDDSTSIGHDHVRGIYETRDGTVWVGTIGGGLSRFIPETKSFVHYRHEPDNPDSIGGDCVRDIFEDEAGALWLGLEVCPDQGEGGLDRFDRKTGTFSHFRHDPDDPHSLSSDRIRGIWGDPEGRLWIGTWGGGLDHFDPATGRVEHRRHDASDEGTLSSDWLWHLFGREDALWISTIGGLNRLDLQSGRITRYLNDPKDPYSLGDNDVYATFEDHSGALWIATARGVNRVDWDRTRFAHYTHDPDDPTSLGRADVWAIHPSRTEPDIVWIGTGGGLSRFDRNRGTFENYHVPLTSSWGGIATDVFAIAEDSQGILWLGSPGGLQRFDPRSRTVRPLPRFASDIQSESIRSIGYGRESNVFWIGTYGAFYKLDLTAETLDRNTITDTNHLLYREAAFERIVEDADGQLWLSTEQGLVRFDPRTSHETVYRYDPLDPSSISSERIHAVVKDDSGFVWVATYKGGLNRLDPKTGRFRRYTMQNSGMPSNTIYEILRDGDGHLWLSTARGLVRFDLGTETIQTFGLERAIQSWDFNQGAAAVASTGELLFGGINGFNILDPTVLVPDPVPPRTVLVDLKVAGRRVAPGSELLPVRLSAAREVRLAHDQNNVAIDYVGLHYAASEKNRYAYMLDGYDADWVMVGAQRTAIYTNLDPGNYTFRVRSANADGIWSEPASVALIVASPWWQTPFAYFCYGLFFIGGIVATDRVRRRQVQRDERERALMLEKELRAEAAEAQSRALQAENERKTQELDSARAVQLSMLPRSTPLHPNLRVAARMQTATEIGGDYYDWLTAEDGTLTVAIGDATGHGAGAGTMVTAAKSLFTHAAERADLARFLADASLTIRTMGLHRLYLAFALVRIRGAEVEIAGAGMPPALVYRAATAILEEFPMKGLPLGAPLAPGVYHTTRLTLGRGDIMLLMSDGFPELFDGMRRMYGYAEVKEAFMRAVPATPDEVVDRLMDVVRHHSGGAQPNDDVTLVAIQMTANVPATEGGSASGTPDVTALANNGGVAVAGSNTLDSTTTDVY